MERKEFDDLFTKSVKFLQDNFQSIGLSTSMSLNIHLLEKINEKKDEELLDYYQQLAAIVEKTKLNYNASLQLSKLLLSLKQFFSEKDKPSTTSDN